MFYDIRGGFDSNKEVFRESDFSLNKIPRNPMHYGWVTPGDFNQKRIRTKNRDVKSPLLFCLHDHINVCVNVVCVCRHRLKARTLGGTQ